MYPSSRPVRVSTHQPIPAIIVTPPPSTNSYSSRNMNQSSNAIRPGHAAQYGGGNDGIAMIQQMVGKMKIGEGRQHCLSKTQGTLHKDESPSIKRKERIRRTLSGRLMGDKNEVGPPRGWFLTLLVMVNNRHGRNHFVLVSLQHLESQRFHTNRDLSQRQPERNGRGYAVDVIEVGKGRALRRVMWKLLATTWGFRRASTVFYAIKSQILWFKNI
ncbi:hypothetical protein L218DRAFT_992255 [Marasmius fiardii PR-910]|nr:hypothetical protein L218DRAFT_992255 [Marasmius fiardii PR-910]